MRLEHDHSREAIAARLDRKPQQSYIRDWVYGGIDGAVTTFAIVAGVVGAELSAGIILILGLANLLADGFSMAASNYSGTKADLDDLHRLKAIERKHIRLAPEGEREEIRHILRSKGIEGEALEQAVTAITTKDELWINTMLAEEYGVSPMARSPVKAGFYTFLAFLVCGAVPLLPFALGLPHAFEFALGATAAVFFGIGSVKSHWSLAAWWRSGLETLVIGLLAAGTAYLVGALLKNVV
ncbi:VIT1/CCC1 transporter family protein [Kaustia mangrovi]|uniref:VIT1/CCC1 transporter family protein n=1 Tax=Kaustia mangrovi TaxID=2593653 RepID=A0A7S8HBY4_9HYPH|nr:VIT1/CCC1 transporter family protein [Kaustia mangrovi]QPC43065.1 VIT1/CCC1 transporter family protein [Kaustia mangrovi]